MYVRTIDSIYVFTCMMLCGNGLYEELVHGYLCVAMHVHTYQSYMYMSVCLCAWVTCDVIVQYWSLAACTHISIIHVHVRVHARVLVCMGDM